MVEGSAAQRNEDFFPSVIVSSGCFRHIPRISVQLQLLTLCKICRGVCDLR